MIAKGNRLREAIFLVRGRVKCQCGCRIDKIPPDCFAAEAAEAGEESAAEEEGRDRRRDPPTRSAAAATAAASSESDDDALRNKSLFPSQLKANKSVIKAEGGSHLHASCSASLPSKHCTVGPGSEIPGDLLVASDLGGNSID